MLRKRWKSIALAGALAVGMFSLAAYADPLVAYDFDEGEGTTVHDFSGNDYDGAILTKAPIWSPYGKYGACLDFNEGYGVTVPAELFDRISDQITVSLWVIGDANQKAKDTVMFQAGRTKKGKPYVATIRVERGDVIVINFMTRHDDSNDNTISCSLRPNEWNSRWNHFTFVKNSRTGIQQMYVNGALAAETKNTFEPVEGICAARIAMAPDRNGDRFSGKLDDFLIYNRALTPGQVKELYAAAQLRVMLKQTNRQGRELLRQQPQKALSFLEGKISECDTLRKKTESSLGPLNDKVMFFDAYCLLAQAGKAAGLPQAKVDAAYKIASEQGRPSLGNCASVLQWLLENDNVKEYERILAALVRDNEDFLKPLAAGAQQMISRNNPQGAVKLLSAGLEYYVQWHQQHPYDDISADLTLPAAWFQLAKAQEKAGIAKSDVANTYTKALLSSGGKYTLRRMDAVMWLIANAPIQFDEIIKTVTQSAEIPDTIAAVISEVCRRCESKNDWSGFQRFVDALLAEDHYPFRWTKLVESSLTDKTNQWAKQYYALLDSKVHLKFARDCIEADAYIAAENSAKAAESFLHILQSGVPADAKSALQFRYAKALFDAGQKDSAAAALEQFIADNKTSNRVLIQKALLLKGHVCIQLGQLDKAMDGFFTLLAEYPEVENLPEVHFFVGYCYMLQTKFETASQFFQSLIRDYPESFYATKARKCIERIEEIKRVN